MSKTPISSKNEVLKEEVDLETGELKRKTLMIVSTINYVVNAPENYEHPKGESLTVPDMSMGIQQIMEKYVQGHPIDQYEAVYFDDEMPDPSKLDLVELDELKESIKGELQRIEDLYQQKVADQNKLDLNDKNKEE